MSFRMVLVLSLHVFICALMFQSSEATVQSWFKIGYWYNGSEFPVSDINSAFYTHLICAFADVNTSSFEISVSSSNQQSFSTFTNTVKLKNPSITTLLSTGGDQNSVAIKSMLSNTSSRKPFIQSSIRLARLYGFQGLDLSWSTIETSSDADNLGQLFREWRVAAKSEAEANSTLPELILTAAVQASPDLVNGSYPVDSIRSNLNWIHVNTYSYHTPTRQNFTAAPSALYDPGSNHISTDYYIKAWLGKELAANMLILGLPFFGFEWTLQNPSNNKIGALATGPAGAADDGSISYKDIKNVIQQNGAAVLYNDTYVTNYCSFDSTWIGFDDVEVVQKKVSYAREKGLLGYYVWQISHDDDNWTLSRAAAEQVDDDKQKRWKLLVIILSIIATVILMLGVTICFQRNRIFKSTGTLNAVKHARPRVNNKEAAGPFHGDAPDLHVYRFSDIEAATNEFSYENKLGQGGYGPVYKGILPDGQEIAVKKLSKASTQGFEEFKNEVTLTARLQHVNLVQLLGFCIERGEQMLVYEYMANKSLDFYLFDPIRRLLLDWNKRVGIIDGITQGLLYLQEYSRFTIIHRDLKASNILLDPEMKPKISDFGMARIFTKNEQEANTSKIVGTYGYVPPEYVKQGVYSTKSDVYSFGVLLLQIISGKKTGGFYGENEDLKLLEYAYELWKEGEGMELMDDSLDDTSSPCKLMRCMQIALLCVQEHANDRPSMLEVSSMLRSENKSLAAPKRPAFSKVKDEEEVKECQPLEIISVNNVTITEMVGR
ncbi:Receptor serine/threonine-protein kinase SD1-8 [Spatholobus suberectus]|nr:Receptor serine/threonine-protein kinase SD1-8 [Spatholobus suberectus]